MVQKDLLRELRSRQIAPRMLLLGCSVCFLLTYQAGVIPSQLQRLSASLCWMTLGFAAVLTLGPSFNSEREQGCWNALLSYPVPIHVIYLSKVAFNSLVFGVVQLVVVSLFAMMCDASWWDQPAALILVLVLGNLGVTSAGTLMGAMSSEIEHGEGMLAVLLFPLLAPVLLAASEATRLIGDDQTAGDWSRWVQLLAAFAVVYLTAGWVLFEYVVED
jgi:heme exporter protein B